jgi:hypothetical protein
MSLARGSGSSRLAIVLGCLATTLAPPAVAHAIVPAEALRLLNLQRAANGIPGDVVEAQGLSDGCAKHNGYIGLNGVLASGEDPAKPGYTPAGDRQTLDASGSEVLSSDATWSETSNPWLLAPIRLFRVFDPEVAVAGYSDAGGIACMRLRGGRAPAAAPQLYSVPASGRTGVATSELNRDTPYAPQQLVDIPAGQATGPNVLLFTRGLRASQPLGAAAFSLTGPQGPVGARLVTETTANAVGNGAWFRGGGVMIPVAPLAPFATYVARVTWHRDAEGALPAADADQVVSFETAGLPNAIDVSVVSRADVNDIHVTTTAPNPTLKLTGPRQLTDVVVLRDGTASYPALDPGMWTACARSGGREVGYVPATVCKTFTAAAKLALSLAPDRAPTYVALRVPRVAGGRRAQVTVARYRLDCKQVGGHRRCMRRTVGRAVRSEVTLTSPKMRVKLPRPKPAVKVTVRVVVGAFTIGDAPYLRSDVRRTWG